MQARKIDDIEIELVEVDPKSLAVVRSMGVIETPTGDVEVAMHINDGVIEFRSLGDPVRIFKVNLRQLCERSVGAIQAHLSGDKVKAPEEA
ncbi:hypothetical protein K3727_09575 [Rhodobacteraceae bacterium M382]|nr:hypothetical protein K3727_09575 [Rhodobacteraceae bacterium M382]